MDNRPKIAAIATTLIFLALVVGLLLSLRLTYSSAEMQSREWPPVDSAELLFANEFVAAGDIAPMDDEEPAPVAESAPSTDAHDMTDAGAAAPHQADIVATDRPAEMTVKKKTEEQPKGPTKEQIEREQKAKAQKETAEAISSRVNFGGASAGGQGKTAPQSAGQGSATDGVASAEVGGRSLEHWSKPSARATGTIRVRVAVDRQGRVVRADYYSGSGAVATQQSARESCERAALKSQFSVALDGPVTQIGYITYRFR